MGSQSILETYVYACAGGELPLPECAPLWQFGIIALSVCDRCPAGSADPFQRRIGARNSAQLIQTWDAKLSRSVSCHSRNSFV
jgi:hypothetical protein